MTKEQLSKMTIPMPFAGGNGASVYDILKPSGTRPNFEDGFPANYSAPKQAGGSFILRSEMNGLGKMASMNQWFQQAGGYYTFDTEWCNAQSPAGYPKDAILHHISSGMLVAVRSLVDNNTWDFRTAGIDGVHWEVCTPSALMFPMFNSDKRRILWTKLTSMSNQMSALSGNIIMPFDGFINYVADNSASMGSYNVENVIGLTEENGAITSLVFQSVPQLSVAAMMGSLMGVVLGITSPNNEDGTAPDVIVDTGNIFSGERNCAVFHVDGMGLSSGGAGCGAIPCKKGSKIKVFGRQTYSRVYYDTITRRVHTNSGGSTSEMSISSQGAFQSQITIEAYPITNGTMEA